MTFPGIFNFTVGILYCSRRNFSNIFVLFLKYVFCKLQNFARFKSLLIKHQHLVANKNLDMKHESCNLIIYRQINADLHLQPLSLKILFFTLLDFWLYRTKVLLVIPDRLEKILVRNIEFEKIEFESHKGCDCRSVLACIRNYGILQVVYFQSKWALWQL